MADLVLVIQGKSALHAPHLTSFFSKNFGAQHGPGPPTHTRMCKHHMVPFHSRLYNGTTSTTCCQSTAGPTTVPPALHGATSQQAHNGTTTSTTLVFFPEQSPKHALDKTCTLPLCHTVTLPIYFIWPAPAYNALW